MCLANSASVNERKSRGLLSCSGRNRFLCFIVVVVTAFNYYSDVADTQNAINRDLAETMDAHQQRALVVVNNPNITTTAAVVMRNEPTLDQLFDEKRTILQTEPSDDCYCPNGRNNWIHYMNCGLAGINDRHVVLRYVMWLADELCANVAVKCNPHRLLDKKRHGCYAPTDAKWDAYFTPMRLGTNNTKTGPRAKILHWDVNATTFNGLRILKNSNIKDYSQGRKLHSQGIPFVWKFRSNWWMTPLNRKDGSDWPSPVDLPHRNYADTCGIVDLDTTPQLLNVAQLALKELNITYSSEFVTMHLRRGGDKVCDTSPEVVMEYLNCSITEDGIKKVIVFTNGEAEYVKNLTQTFSKAFPKFDMVLLDQLFESEGFVDKLNEQNLLYTHSGDGFLKDNCFKFRAEQALTQMARYHLERGRRHCEACDRGGSLANTERIDFMR